MRCTSGEGGARAAMVREAEIVVIDDEHEVLDLVCELLEDEGYDVLCLDRPSKVIRDWEQYHPDLFILDLMLPEMSGIELARHLREDGFPKTPMVAMSASEVVLHAAAETQLFQRTLPKPFHVDALLDCGEHYVR